ncbi:class I SAM-dependent methyltransferase [Microvirga massiliensis]|uniref:class I SAM-dependent methyltransferase n=1 Tax=Microvirga massiliensis TaxID=1033741 RepID=UPI00066006CB|nr:class I SAM-dependent methyltransferase [Microvirga massiliensis]
MELADLPFRAKQALRPTYLRIRTVERWIQYHLGVFESEAKIERDAQRFWNAEDERLRQHSHWRGAGIFQDDARWMALGQEHRQLYEKFARMLGVTGRPQRIVDWGCGGGADALHFAPLAQDYVGIDISQDNLEECSRLLANAGLTNFTPVLIRTDAPEDARTLVPLPCDLFLCIGVFEILPTPEYGYRVLEIARDLLADGGMAIVQVKYVKDSWVTRPKRFGYRRNFPILTTYPIDEFWTAAEARGLKPQAITLQPYQPLIGNGDYAFFCLTKESSSVN